MADSQVTLPPVTIDPALALLEFSSIAAGVLAADAMVKKAPLDIIRAGTVQPGRFLVLVGGPVAEVEEARRAGLDAAPDVLTDHIFLPGVHPDVVRALAGGRSLQPDDALGVIETASVPAAIQAADTGVKGAQVNLMEVRLADGLGGKGIVLFTGVVADVEAALDLAEAALTPAQKVRRVLISQLHNEIAQIMQISTRFGTQLGWRW